MTGTVLGMVSAALLLAAVPGPSALAQNGGGAGPQSQQGEAAAPDGANAARRGLEYPPCSQNVEDRCIQLGQRDLNRAYPNCAKIADPDRKAACIEQDFSLQRSGRQQ